MTAPLSATIVSSRPIHYHGGADLVEDRPGFARAGSALTRWRDVLVMVQDDANFLAIIDPETRTAQALTLPPGVGGARQFDDLRGNKHHKLDLEACVVVPELDGPALLILGSGSTSHREVAIVVRHIDGGSSDIELYRLPELYGMLRTEQRFSGSELNIEGAVLAGDRIRLFNRGNGARRGDHCGVNATADLSWPALREHLREPQRVPPPRLEHITQYDLGTIDGVPLTFTDAVAHDGRIFYVATAEASPDAVRDGEVKGSAVGVIDDGGVRWAVIQEQNGPHRFAGKVEGVCADPAHEDRLLIAVDRDDPQLASELCEVVLRGPW